MFQLENFELCVMTLMVDAKFKGIMTNSGSKNHKMYLVSFHASSRKYGNWHLGKLLSI